MIEMTSRERVLTAAHRQVPDRVPRDILLEKRVAEMLARRLGGEDLQQALRIDVVYLYPGATIMKNDYSRYFQKPNVTWDEWGRGRIWDNEDHYAEYLYPLENAETVDEILDYPWPDLTEAYRYTNARKQVEMLHAQGYAVIGDISETVFEIAWQLRSMDRLFEDILHQDEKAMVLLDKITERTVAGARAFAKAGVDILYTGDDVAMQTGLMMSRKMWRQWFMPRLERVILAARQTRPDILIKYHSDGKINDLIPDLIEAGVDILNPVQPECVDHAWLKKTYGNQLAFDGGLGVQSVLPFGTTEQVRSHVKETIATLGAGGGLIIGPSHVIERDTSFENIMAMLEAIDQYGRTDS